MGRIDADRCGQIAWSTRFDAPGFYEQVIGELRGRDSEQIRRCAPFMVSLSNHPRTRRAQTEPCQSRQNAGTRS